MSPPADGRPGLLRGVDRAAFAVALAARLRAAGVPVGLTGVEDLTRALAAYPPDSRSRLYWTARITLLRRQADVAAFDAVFGSVFDDAMLPLAEPPAGRSGAASGPAGGDAYTPAPRAGSKVPGAGGLPWLTLPRVV